MRTAQSNKKFKLEQGLYTAFGKPQEEGDATGHDVLTVAGIETENKDA